MEQLLHVHFVLFAVYQNVKTLFSKTNMPVYAWKIFLENTIEMVSIIPSNRASEAQTFRNNHPLANFHRTQWKHVVFISEGVSCIHVWRTPLSVVPIYRTVHYKNESWTDGHSLSRKIQMCSCVKCTRVSGNFSLMLSIDQTECLTVLKRRVIKPIVILPSIILSTFLAMPIFTPHWHYVHGYNRYVRLKYDEDDN